MTVLCELLGRGWELAAAAVPAAVWLLPGPDDGEEFPEDPDRARDWALADEMEVL